MIQELVLIKIFAYPLNYFPLERIRYFVGKFKNKPIRRHITVYADGLSYKRNKIEEDDWKYIFEQFFCQEYLEK